MRNILSVLAASFGLLTCSFATINAVNGVTASTSSNVNGVTAPSAVNGQTLASGGSPVTFTDTFDRANEDPLSDGGAWTNGVTGYGNMRVNTNDATASTSNGLAIVTTPSYASYANQSATITLTSSTSNVAVVLRYDTSGNGYVCYLNDPTTIRVYRVTAAAGTQLGADFTITTVSASDTIGMGISGSTLTVYRNGASQGTRTDSTWTTGSPGIYAGTNTSTIASYSCTSL